MILALAGLSEAFAHPARPAYAPLRYDEDWSSMAQRANQTDYFDSFKYIVLCERCRTARCRG